MRVPVGSALEEANSRTAGKVCFGSRAYLTLLASAVLVPFCILVLGVWLAWTQVWRQAESELTYATDAVSEYAAHLLDGHKLLADRVNDLIRGLTDEEIRAREPELHAALQRMAVDRPWVLSLYAIDAKGRPLVSANVFPVPREADLQDRDFFQALRNHATPSTFISKIYIGRFDDQLFFSVAERRSFEPVSTVDMASVTDHVSAPFRGVVLASLRPNVLAESLRRLSGQPDDLLAIVRTDGELVVRSSGFEGPPSPLLERSPMLPVMTIGADRAVVRDRSELDGIERLTALRRVDGWPLYASATRARATVLTRWRHTIALQVAFAVPAIGGLVLLVGSTYRRSREVAEARASLHVEATRRAAAEALRESEEHLRLAQEAGGVGTWEWNPERRVATCSEGYRKLYGLDLKGPGHQSPEDWLAQVHPDDRDRVQWFKGTSPPSGRMQNEYRIIRPDGATRWIVDRGVALYDAEGKLVRLLGANVDITEAREAEERLRELQSQVLHASRLSAMGQMAAAMAHELNQPIGAASNFLNAASTALRKGAPDGPARALARLEKAAEQTLRAGAILRRLRDFVTRGECDKRILSARGLVEDAVALALIGNRHPALRVKFDFASSDPHVLADQIQIQQVLFNLVKNALEAMEGQGERELVLTTRIVREEEAEISVADSGPGLPANAKTLFRPFETSKEKGMGIGLSICRTIIEAHGGRLWAEPRPGGGTLFRFTLATEKRDLRHDQQAPDPRGG